MNISRAWTALWSLDEPHRVSVHPVKGKRGQFFWHEQAGNGEITNHSQNFTRHADAIRAARAHCEASRVFVEEKPKPFVLVAGEA